MTNEQRQQRKVAGQAGGLKRAAWNTRQELGDISRRAVYTRWEREVLAVRPDLATRSAELERAADKLMRAYMASMRAKSVQARRERVIVKATRPEGCYQCVVDEGGQEWDPAVRITPCYRHMAQEMLKDPDYTPTRTLWVIAKVAQEANNMLREANRALKDKLAGHDHHDRDEDQAS